MRVYLKGLLASRLVAPAAWLALSVASASAVSAQELPASVAGWQPEQSERACSGSPAGENLAEPALALRVSMPYCARTKPRLPLKRRSGEARQS